MKVFSAAAVGVVLCLMGVGVGVYLEKTARTPVGQIGSAGGTYVLGQLGERKFVLETRSGRVWELGETGLFEPIWYDSIVEGYRYLAPVGAAQEIRAQQERLQEKEKVAAPTFDPTAPYEILTER